MTDTHWDPAPFLDKMLGVAPGIIYVFNQDTQSNEYTNRSLGEVLGYSSDELRDMGDAFMPSLCHPDDLPHIGQYFAAIKELVDDEVLSIEYRMRHKNGQWVWLSSHDAVFDRHDDGSVHRHIGIATDISVQKRQELELAEAQDKLEKIFDGLSSGIVALDADGQVTRINSVARDIIDQPNTPTPFAWPAEAVFLDRDTVQKIADDQDPIQRILSGGLIDNETYLMRGQGDPGDFRYVRIKSAALEKLRSGASVVMVLDDVSEQERNRLTVERKNRLDALGQLTGGIAHDFNNVLASLLYAVDLAGSATDAAKRQKYLTTATETINRGSALTNRLLAFAKRQPGLARVKRTADVLTDFETLIRPMLEEHITVEFVPGDEDLFHFCDQTQLETALMNLVLNARDAINSTGQAGRIVVRARAVQARWGAVSEMQTTTDQNALSYTSDRFVEFSVSDDGPGMDSETLSRCADPFFSTKEESAGTGLGLAMVYGFASQAKGDLRIYSELGIGTTVQITLPRGTMEGTRETAMPNQVVAKGAGESILLVEDEGGLLDMMSDVIRELGYDVITAENADAALVLVKDGVPFDLLVTDVVMPGEIGGFELARHVRELRPDMPVIYVSGYSGFTLSEMGEVQAELLQKPVSPAELAQAISHALRS